MSIRILQGDCRDVLRTLADASVHCIVTSPPYYGLRDYGVDGQMGLEPTPDEYIAGMVAMFHEGRRGAGAYDRNGCKRAYWRKRAANMAAQCEAVPPFLALCRACGWQI